LQNKLPKVLGGQLYCAFLIS